MVLISLRELIWQDYLIVSICLIVIIINMSMSVLFFKKFFKKKSTMQLVLGLFHLVSAYVVLIFGFIQMVTINSVWDHLLLDADIIGIVLLPLLLIRIAHEICKSKPSFLVEIVFFGTKLVCFIPVLLIPTNEFISYLVFVPMAIMLIFVGYFLIYKPHKVKKDLHLDDPVLKTALDIVGVSAILFLVVLFAFTMYAIFHEFLIELTGFFLYFSFLITVYLGYYNPLWWRRIISRKGDYRYCYGEFDECLNLIEKEERQEQMIKEFEDVEDTEDIKDIEELDDVEELKDLINGLENLRELGDLKDPDDSE